MRARRGQHEIDTSNSYDLVASLIATSKTDDDDDDESESATREANLLLLRLQWSQAAAQTNSIEQELELLHNAPPEETDEGGTEAPPDDTWRLDAPSQRLTDTRGPLLDSSGRVR